MLHGLLIDTLKPCLTLSASTGHSSRHLRPTCQVFDLESFLDEHRETLTHIKFDNVIFAQIDRNFVEDHQTPAFWRADDTTAEIVQRLEMHPGKLEHMEWIVNVIGHDRRCKHDKAALGCRQHDCGSYVNDGPAASKVEDFMEMAQSIHVRPDEETQTWDFGEYVMKALRRRKCMIYRDEEHYREQVEARLDGAELVEIVESSS